jgi:hypothetical protein
VKTPASGYYREQLPPQRALWHLAPNILAVRS